MNREIKDEEIIILITKYLRDNGYSKTLKSLQKETSQQNIDYSEIDSIRDLKWVLNDYFRLRSEEIGKQELSHSLSLSFGPEIEQMYKQLETILSDYSQYRKIIESQVNQINECYNIPQTPSRQDEQDSICQPSEIGDNEVNSMNDMNLPMEQYLHLYRTLPNILPDVINETLTNNQVIDDAAIDSIFNSLQEKSALGDILPTSPPAPIENSQGTVPISTRKTPRKTTPKMKSIEDSSFVSKRYCQGE